MIKQIDHPTMQDLSKGNSLISDAFTCIRPLETSFDPEGSWTHVYEDISSHFPKRRGKGHWRPQGKLTLKHAPRGMLHIENYRNCGQGYRSYTLAELQCQDDVLRSPVAWKVETKVSKAPGDAAHLNSGLVKRATVKGNVLTVKSGDKKHTVTLPGPTTCKWCLLDAVGRMAAGGTKEVGFSLLDEYDELCPEQKIRFTGVFRVKTAGSTIEVKTYQHTGIGTMPGVYYVDAAGRVLFYLAGMQLLALGAANGEKVGNYT